jgi:hypothetical protein
MSLRSRLHIRLPLRHSVEGRDAALDRLRRLNRSIIAGSVALTAIFADTAANTFAGGTAHPKGTAARHGKAAKKSQPTHTTTRPGPLAPPSESPSQAPEREREPEPEATPTQEPAAPSEEASPQAQEPAAEPQRTEAPTQTESAPEPAQEEAPVVSGAS